MDADSKERARRRAADRGNWPVRVYRVGQEPLQDPLDCSTVEQRLATMWPLAKEAWSMARRELPRYQRSETPGKLVRGGR